jgi:ComEC/Rec2-related protein
MSRGLQQIFKYHWQTFPVLPILICLVAGKLLADLSGEFDFWIPLSLMVLLFTSGFLFLKGKADSPLKRNIRTLNGYAIWLCIGMMFRGENPEPNWQKGRAFIFKTQEILGEKLKGNRMRILGSLESVLIQNQWQKAEGNLIINLKGTENQLSYGSRYVVSKPLQEIEPASIPGQFDAKTYYKRKGIFYQVYTSDYELKRVYPDQKNPLYDLAFFIRSWLVEGIENSVYEKKDADVLIALLLGIRRKIDPELKAAHSAAGTSHILAVSGMHVALIFGFLRFMLAWLQNFKGGKLSFSISIICLLWLYALVTGLSPSVNRAVMVFTVLQLGDLIKKPKYPINSLCLATLILFFFDPEIIYDVGYQLSFAAVYGILSFQKPITSMWSPRANWQKKIWDDIALTLSATLATSPIILFYFHQFPVYFLLANLVAVPLSNGLIYMGIGLLALSWIPWVKLAGGMLIHFTIWILNGFILQISKLPFSVIENLFIPWWVLVPFFGFLILLQLFFFRMEHKWLLLSLVAFFGYSGSVFAYQVWLWNRPEKTYVIRTGEEWMFASITGRQARLALLGSDTLKNKTSFEAKSLREGFHVLDVDFEKIPGKTISWQKTDSTKQSRLLFSEKKTILILGNYLKFNQKPKEKLKIDVLISKKAGFKTLENAFLVFQPKEIWGNFSEKSLLEFTSKFPQYQWVNFKSNRFQPL